MPRRPRPPKPRRRILPNMSRSMDTETKKQDAFSKLSRQEEIREGKLKLVKTKGGEPLVLSESEYKTALERSFNYEPVKSEIYRDSGTMVLTSKEYLDGHKRSERLAFDEKNRVVLSATDIENARKRTKKMLTD